MKRRNPEHELQELTNLNDSTVQEIAEHVPVLDEAAKDRITALCERKMMESMDVPQTGSMTYASGVGNITRNTKYRRLAAAAACLLAAIGIAGAAILGNRPPSVPDTPITNATTENAAVTETAEADTTETSPVHEDPQPTNDLIQCELIMEDDNVWDNVTEHTLTVTEEDWKSLPIPSKRYLRHVQMVDGKLVFLLCIPPENPNAQMSTEMEIGMLDPATEEYTSLTVISHQYEGTNPCFTVADRYVVFCSAAYADDGTLCNQLVVCDAQTGTASLIDSTALSQHEIVQYAAPLGESGIVYWYREEGSGEIVIRHYDLTSGRITDISRMPAPTDADFQPMAIASDGTDIVMLMQQNTGNAADGNTIRFMWFSGNGIPLKTETLPLNSLRFHECQRLNGFSIQDNYYCLDGNDIIYLFERQGNTFTVQDLGDNLPEYRMYLTADDTLHCSMTDSSTHSMVIKPKEEQIEQYDTQLTEEAYTYFQLFSDDTIVMMRDNNRTYGNYAAEYCIDSPETQQATPTETPEAPTAEPTEAETVAEPLAAPNAANAAAYYAGCAQEYNDASAGSCYLSFAYPQFSENVQNAQAINQTIRTFAEEYIAYQFTSYGDGPNPQCPKTQFGLSTSPVKQGAAANEWVTNFTITRADEQFVSIVFKGHFYGGARPYSTAKALMIDAETGEEVMFYDMYNIGGEIAQLIHDAYTIQVVDILADNEDTRDSLLRDNKPEYLQEIFLPPLHYVEDHYAYLTQDGVTVLLGILHAYGDYAEVHLSYEALEAYCK